MMGRVCIAAVLCAATLNTCLGFLVGLPAQLGDRQTLRGSSGQAPKPSSQFGEALSGSLLAVGTLAAVVGARRRDESVGARRRDESTVTMQLTRSQWYRKVKRISQDRAIFDVTVPKPLGIKLEPIPDRKQGQGAFRGVGVSEITKGGNADEVNRSVCETEEGSGMWILEGDRVIAVEGTECVDANIDQITQLIKAQQGDTLTMTFVRNTRTGPIKVVMMPGGETATVRRGANLSAACEYAFGKTLKYGCIDGWCGTCWHRERTTDGVFKPCCDVLTGDWDNVMPLVLTAKPEKAGDLKIGEARGA